MLQVYVIMIVSTCITRTQCHTDTSNLCLRSLSGACASRERFPLSLERDCERELQREWERSRVLLSCPSLSSARSCRCPRTYILSINLYLHILLLSMCLTVSISRLRSRSLSFSSSYPSSYSLFLRVSLSHIYLSMHACVTQVAIITIDVCMTRRVYVVLTVLYNTHHNTHTPARANTHKHTYTHHSCVLAFSLSLSLSLSLSRSRAGADARSRALS